MAFENESSVTGQPRLLITAAVAAGKRKIDAGYDVQCRFREWYLCGLGGGRTSISSAPTAALVNA